MLKGRSTGIESNMRLPLNKRQTLLAIATILLSACAFYFAYRSGRAMTAAVGMTVASQEFQALAALFSFPAMCTGVALITAEQAGTVVVRLAKFGVTCAYWFILQTLALLAIESLAYP